MSKYKMCNVQGTNCIIDTTTNKIVDTVENLVRDSITLSEINDLIDSLPVHDDISLVVDIIEENKNK